MPISGRYITSIKNIENNTKKEPKNLKENIEILHDTKIELQNAISELETEIKNHVSQVDKTTQAQKLVESYSKTLEDLKKDQEHLTKQIFTLENIKQQNQELYNKLEALSEIKQEELNSKIGMFKQLIDENSNNQDFKNYLILFTFKKFVHSNSPKFLKLLTHYIEDMKLSDINFSDEFGKTILFYAIEGNKLSLVHDLISKGANVNHQSLLGYTPLHVATLGNKKNIVEVLLKATARSEIGDYERQTPIMKLIIIGLLGGAEEYLKIGLTPKGIDFEGQNVIHMLLGGKVGSNINLDSPLVVAENEPITIGGAGFNSSRVLSIIEFLSKNKVLEFNTLDNKGKYPIHYAANYYSIEILKYLIQAGFDPSVMDSYNQTCLFLASQGGNIPIVEFLAQEYPSMLSQVSIKGASPLQTAANHGHKEVVSLLVNSGVPVDQNNDILKATPLWLAAQEGHIETVQYLIKYGADINFQGINLASPLHQAVTWNHLSVVQLLAKQKTLKIDLQNIKGLTPFYIACSSKYKDIAEYILDNLNPDLNIIDNNGFSGLSWAMQIQDLPFLSKVISKTSPELLDLENIDRITPLYYAVSKGAKEIANYILSIKPDCKLIMSNGNTMLHAAANSGDRELFELYLSKGLSLNAANHVGNLITHYLAENGSNELLVEVIKKGAVSNIKNNEGFTPMHMAAQNGHIEVVKILLSIEKQADPISQNVFGCTPLYLAAQNGHIDVVKYLLENNVNPANPNFLASNYYIPLYIALENKHYELVNFLLKYTNPNLIPKSLTQNNNYDYEEICNDIKIMQTELKRFIPTLPHGKLEDVREYFIKFDSALFFFLFDNCTYKLPQGQSFKFIANALHLAVLLNNAPLIDFLIKKGFDLNVITNDLYNLTPFTLACKTSKHNMANYLIDKYLDKLSLNIKDNTGYNSLLWALELLNPKIIKDIINKSPELINEGDNYNRTPIHWLSMYPKYFIYIDTILEAHPDLNVKTTSDGCTPLVAAVVNGLNNVVERFLNEPSLDIMLLNEKDTHKSPIHYAALHNNVKAIKLLYDYFCQKFSQLEAVSYMDIDDKVSATPLYYAAQNNKLEAAQLLLYFNPNCKLITKNNDTVIHAAARTLNIPMVSLIKNKFDELGISLDIITDYKGQNILHIFTALHKQQVNFNGKIVNLDTTKCIEWALKSGVSINFKDNSGNTPLHFLMKQPQDLSLILGLVKQVKAKVNIENNDGQSILSLINPDFKEALLASITDDNYENTTVSQFVNMSGEEAVVPNHL